MDIKTLLDQDGIKLKKESRREFSGACPWCGGRDRFRVWPDENGGGFWCRVCNKGGDMVKYHMLSTGKKYFDACYDLGIEPRFKPRQRGGYQFKRALPPPLAWRQQAVNFIDRAHRALLTKKGAKMRSWLAERGISEKSMRAMRLGLNTSNRNLERSAWALPEEKGDSGKRKTIWIPCGLVIPCLASGEPIRIRVRRTEEASARYVTISGSSSAPMRLGRLGRVAIVESDLDAILISQQAGDIASVISLGSVSLWPDHETHKYLKAAEIILLSLDYDKAGAAQLPWWQQHYGATVKRWPVPTGKDPGEAYQAGIDIRKWIQAGLLSAKGSKAYFWNHLRVPGPPPGGGWWVNF